MKENKMKKLLCAILLSVSLSIPVMADNLTWNPINGVTVAIPFDSLSVDYLVNVNPQVENEKVQFLAGLRSPIVSYGSFNLNIGAITDTGFNYRAYYSIGYDYVQKNPNLLFILNEINIAAFFSTYFDGQPNLYGIALSKKLW